MAYTWTLSVLNDDGSTGMVLSLDPPGGLLGRAEDNAFVLDYDSISHVHCKLSVDPEGEWWLEDLNSTNGIWKDEQEINGLHRLREGEVLEVGVVKVRVEKETVANPDPLLHDKAEVQEPGADDSHRILVDDELDCLVIEQVPMDKPIFIELEDAEEDLWD